MQAKRVCLEVARYQRAEGDMCGSPSPLCAVFVDRGKDPDGQLGRAATVDELEQNVQVVGAVTCDP